MQQVFVQQREVNLGTRQGSNPGSQVRGARTSNELLSGLLKPRQLHCPTVLQVCIADQHTNHLQPKTYSASPVDGCQSKPSALAAGPTSLSSESYHISFTIAQSGCQALFFGTIHMVHSASFPPHVIDFPGRHPIEPSIYSVIYRLNERHDTINEIAMKLSITNKATRKAISSLFYSSKISRVRVRRVLSRLKGNDESKNVNEVHPGI